MSKQKEIKNKVDGYSKKVSKLNEFRDLIPRDNMSRLENTVKTFERDAETAIDENRLMRIGVIGQIKRGKSSFLNTFLFDGDEVLPKAATPMTAALTKITYSEKPKATVEFFSKDEWDNIETLAQEKQDLEEKNRRIREERKKLRKKLLPDNKPIEQIQEPTQEQNSSLELVEMARKGGINYQEYLGKEKTIEAASREDLVGKLNDFVGAQGKYTPIVKSSQLALNIPALKHVEIVDTPGMNDPIISRARKTEDFIGQCDVVFFLSYCSQFLDSTDMGLLAQNIPSRGIRNIILIGSLFDGVLLEEYEKYNDIGTAIRDLTERKEKEARNNFDRVKDKIQKETLKEALEKSFPPVFISSRCSDIAKHYNNLSEEEAHTLNRLNEMFDDFTFTPEMLSNLANMEEVGERYDRVKKDKDSILAERFDNIVSGFSEGFSAELKTIEDTVANKEKNLEENDIDTLQKKHELIVSKIDQGKSKISSIFSSHSLNAEKEFSELTLEIEKAATMAKKVKENQGSEERSYEVDKGMGLFAWRSLTGNRYETRHKTVTYRYANVHEALDQLEDYVMQSKEVLHSAVKDIINIKQFKIDITESIKGLFDFSDDNFDPDDILIPVSNAVARITIPHVDLDVDNHIKTIRENFSSNEVRNSEIQTLRNEQARVVKLIMKDVKKEVGRSLKNILDKLKNVQDTFIPELTEDMKKEMEELKEQLVNRQKYLEKYRSCLSAIEQIKGNIEKIKDRINNFIFKSN